MKTNNYIFFLLLFVHSCYASEYHFVQSSSECVVLLKEEDLITFLAAKKCASLTIYYRNEFKGKDRSESFIKDDAFLKAPIDTKNQTISSGLFIEVEHHLPVAISTKWGKWNFLDASEHDDKHNRDILLRVLKHVRMQNKFYLPLDSEHYKIPVVAVAEFVVPTPILSEDVSHAKSSQKKLEWDMLVKLGRKSILNARL